MDSQTQIIDPSSELEVLLTLWLKEEIEWSVVKAYVHDHLFLPGMSWPRISAGLDRVLKRVFTSEAASIEATVEAIMDVVISTPIKTPVEPYTGPRLVWSRPD